METIKDIGYLELFMGYIILVIPILVFWYYRTGLVKDMLIAIARMAGQLFMVGLYLEVIFRLNLWWINTLWVLVMVLIATYTVVRRSELNIKLFFIPVFIALMASILVIDTFFIGAVIRLDYFFESRYFIPITGIILGNWMRTNIIALNSYYKSLEHDRLLFRFYLANGANRHEALVPFIREALRDAFNPVIANISIIGLIALPGVMTGQILGGSSPSVAVKYQIMIMLVIFVGSMITVILTILLTNRKIFDDMDNLAADILRK